MNMIDKIQIERLYWDKKLTIQEIAAKTDIPFWSLYNLMNKYGIKRRDRSEAIYNYNKTKPQFEIKPNLFEGEEKLKIAGVMLYWAEGTLKGNTVDFANSNPYMAQIFLKFLRDICGISEERLRIYLYAYDNQSVTKLRKYWSNILNIPINQFTKPYIRKGNPNLNKRELPYGLVHIRYNDKKLLKLIGSWIEEYKNSSLNWAGTQVAKGDRLSKGSVLPKGRMEK